MRQEMLLALKVRLASFGLMLHEGKTRLIGKRSFLRTYAVERGDGMRCPP
ncbi:hypothetical protein ACVMBY_002323 [Bradyrhizobium huanghuaihaiense]